MPVYTWSTTAATNATADSTINWAEGMAPSAVNDSARAMMAAQKKFYNDALTMAHTTGGTSTAYTLATDSVFDTLAHLDKQQITFVPHATSGASPTLAVDGLAAKAINGPASSAAIPTGALVIGVPYTVLYDNSNNQFILLGYRDTMLNASITGTLTTTGATTHNAAVTISTGGLTVTAGGLTVSASGAAITGNSTVTGTFTTTSTLTASNGFTVSAGTVTFPSASIATASLKSDAGITTGMLSTAATPAMVLLNTITITGGDASESDTTSFTGTYSAYEIILDNVVIATAGSDLRMQVQVGGVFQTSGYLTQVIRLGAGASAVDVSTSSIPLTGNSGQLDNVAPGVSGFIRISDPSVAAIHPIQWDMTFRFNASNIEHTNGGGYYNTSGAVTGFKILASSGNLTSGKIRVYGIL